MRGVLGVVWRAANGGVLRGSRELEGGPVPPLLSLAAALVVGAATLGALSNGSGNQLHLATGEQPRYLQPAVPPASTRVRALPSRRIEPEALTIYIVRSLTDAEQVQVRIDEENRTQDALQRPPISVQVLVALSAADETRIYRALSEMDTVRAFHGHTPIEIIDVRAS